MKTICVFGGASQKAPDSHKTQAYELGTLIGNKEWRLVYGGGSRGMMGQVAHGVRDSKGHITGIIPHFIDTLEGGDRNVDEFYLVDHMHERKGMMYERADAFIIAPGGFGTLDEMFEIVTWKQLQQHKKPVIIANFDGYWEPIMKTIDYIEDTGYLHGKYHDLFTICNNPAEILKTLEEALNG